MTVKSFAQNFEDVLLWRALQHVAGGRYVDVGAGHPEHNSVTKLFYDAGWSGINIEPLPTLADALTKQRPRDVTLQAAVSAREADFADLTVVDLWDELSTISDERAEELRGEGRAVTTTTVPVVRLDEVLAAHGMRDIQFLKVDVEGAELDVLHTIDLTRTRPWIAVVEVVSGNAETNPRRAIRQHLEDHDYVHAYFDGLNDFYLAKELADELLPNFATPVNVTDDFVVVADGDRVMVELIGEKVGMVSPAQASEVMQRVEAVVRDRIDFETRLRDVEAELASRLSDFEAALAASEQRNDEAEERVRARDESIQGLQLRGEALEQTSFERERMVAWYAAEVSNFRNRLQRQESLDAERAERQEAQRRAAQDIQLRLDGVLASTSWRITLPMRAIRRPRTYLKEWVRR
ncbi:FkbM family methyltransferase [Cellulomonas sp. KRMCY2]|uniref:FkbM family methyltransferase n=1 Tax=Cellulomonas sp. KRMCY2 TaxID=1304865 RepID=UPI00045EAE6A|nr:FkbM family methyltransferase [Cellulomonas sp. KRMCY2]